MRKIFLLLLVSLFLTNNSFSADSYFGTVGNRIKVTTTLYTATTGTLVKGSQGEIWALNFQALSSNGSYYVCDANTVASCNTSTGIMAEGSQSVAGNSFNVNYGSIPLQTTNGIVIVVTNGDLIISYN